MVKQFLLPLLDVSTPGNGIAVPTRIVTPSPSRVPVSLPPLGTPTTQFAPRVPTPTIPSLSPIGNLGYYRHPQGIFELLVFTLPLDGQGVARTGSLSLDGGWLVKQDEASATFSRSADNTVLNIQVTQTGYELDAASFDHFVSAREAGLFGKYTGYAEINRARSLADQSLTVTKSLISDLPEIVTTVYRQAGESIYTMDFWIPQSLYPAYAPQIETVVNAVQLHPEAAQDLPAYAWTAPLSDLSGKQQVDVPIGWPCQAATGEFTYVSTCRSPDDHAVIQLVTYNDGQNITKSVAGNFTLLLLNNYMSTDIMVTEDRMLPTGDEQLIWWSPRYDYRYQGVSTFESLGTTFVLFTTLYDRANEAVYRSVLDRAISSYK